MRRLFLLIAISTAAAVAGLAGSLPHSRALAAQRSTSKSTPSPAPPSADAPPTDAELRAFLDRLFANHHMDDAALALFQRIEHRQIREHGSDATPSEDKIFRVVPTGTTYWKVLVEDHGHPLPAADVQTQLANLEHALELINDPANSDMRRLREKFNARLKNHSDLISAVRDAYIFTWVGRESLNGRITVKFRMEPNPKFKPFSFETEFFPHGSATLWADEATAHVVKVEAVLNSDISVGAGVVGKVYRGSRMSIQQAEVAPGIWLPSAYQYDFTGRKFFFSAGIHERTEASRYERIGPPNEALARIRLELSPSVTPRAR